MPRSSRRARAGNGYVAHFAKEDNQQRKDGRPFGRGKHRLYVGATAQERAPQWEDEALMSK